MVESRTGGRGQRWKDTARVELTNKTELMTGRKSNGGGGERWREGRVKGNKIRK